MTARGPNYRDFFSLYADEGAPAATPLTASRSRDPVIHTESVPPRVTDPVWITGSRS